MLSRKYFLPSLFSVLTLFSLFSLVLAQSPNPTNSVQDMAQDSQETIKINTDLVTFDLQILDKKTGKIASGLTEKDFEVYEDGVKQTVTNFSQDRLPLSVLFLLDVSRGIEPIIPQIREATVAAIYRLKPQDEVGLMAFASGTGVLEIFTNNKKEVFTKDKKLIADNIFNVTNKTVALGKDTFINEALSEAAAQVKEFSNPAYRRVIIVVTDNIGNRPFYGRNRDTTIKHLVENGVAVFGLLVQDPNQKIPNASAQNSSSIKPPISPNRPEPQRPVGTIPDRKASNDKFGNRTDVSPTFSDNPQTRSQQSNKVNEPLPNPSIRLGDIKLEPYVKETGGEIIDARSSLLADRFSDLVAYLRSRYSIGYVSTNTKNDNKFRKLKIKLLSSAKQSTSIDKDELLVRIKTGYYGR